MVKEIGQLKIDGRRDVLLGSCSRDGQSESQWFIPVEDVTDVLGFDSQFNRFAGAECSWFGCLLKLHGVDPYGCLSRR